MENLYVQKASEALASAETYDVRDPAKQNQQMIVLLIAIARGVVGIAESLEKLRMGE